MHIAKFTFLKLSFPKKWKKKKKKPIVCDLFFVAPEIVKSKGLLKDFAAFYYLINTSRNRDYIMYMTMIRLESAHIVMNIHGFLQYTEHGLQTQFMLTSYLICGRHER